jgi:hypothetical protein
MSLQIPVQAVERHTNSKFTWRETYSGKFYRKCGSCLLVNEVYWGLIKSLSLFTTHENKKDLDLNFSSKLTFRTSTSQEMSWYFLS